VAGRWRRRVPDFLEGVRRRTSHAVWQAIAIALRGLGRLLDDGPALEAFRAGVRTSSDRRSSRLGDPAADEDDLTGSCAVCSSDARCARRGRRGPGALPRAGSTRQRRSDRRRSRADRRCHLRRRGHRRRRDLRADAAGSSTRRRHRSSCATSTRSPSSTTRTLILATCEFAMSRGQDPERTVPAARGDRQPQSRRRRGRSCATTGRKRTRGSRATRSCGWSTR
jgi:hypothetical protein